MQSIPAIVAAGDGKAAKAIRGESKVYLEVEGRSLVARIVSVLQRVPEVDSVWVVGNAPRLERALRDPALLAELRKPLYVVPQYRNLLENTWQTYRRLLPGAPVEGRDPASEEERDLPVLYLSADLPFATPQEISAFVRRSLALDCDYALGLVPEQAMEDFKPEPGEPGIEMACFQVREGRVRQSNLHLVRPARLANRQAIEDMYEHRYQKQLGAALGLAWKILVNRGGGLRILFYYLLLHVALLFDRVGLRALADVLRRAVTFERVDRACSSLLGTRFRLVVTDVGGCAIDVDNEHDLDVARRRFLRFSEAQARRAERLVGPLPLPERAAGEAAEGPVVLPPGPRALPDPLGRA